MAIRYISIVLLIIIFSLAMISRKNYSKYKAGAAPLGWLASFITSRLRNKDRLMHYIKRIKPLNTRELIKETDKRITALIHELLIILVVFLSLIIVITFIPEKVEDAYTLKRPSLGEQSDYVSLKFRDLETDEEELFKLKVSPREYTKEEFDELAKETVQYIDSVLLGRNTDKNQVTEDLVFPTSYKNSGLKILWETDMPTILGSDGRLFKDNLSEDTCVNIKATVKDTSHTYTYQNSVVIVEDKIISSSEQAKADVLNIEKESRENEEFTIPRELGTVTIEREVESNADKIKTIFIFGLIFIGIWCYYRIFKLKEKGEERDEAIRDAYYGFANRLTIYIGAGFTMQKALCFSVKNETCSFLVDEVEYTLNMISSGVSEMRAYMDMGSRIGIEEYMRLMSLISQNLSFGNSNLLKLIDSEVKTSFFLKKERVRKKGEQASEKLLIPTSILLIIVIVVVMYPAIIGLG